MLKFIKRERIYIWMAFFIVMVNLLSFGHPHKKDQDSIDRKSISTQTFKDMGITEQKVRLFFESKKPSAVFFKYSFFAGFFMLMAGVIMNIIFLFGRKEIIMNKIHEKKIISWGITDIFKVIIIVIFSGYALNAAGAVILRSAHFNMDINLRMMLGTFFIDMIAGVAILYFILMKYREKLSSLGIVLTDFYKNVLSGITAYIFILPILIVVLILSVLFLDKIGYKAPPQPVFDMFFEEKRSNVILFLTVFVSVLGPIIEEIFFRGFLYSAVKKRFGVLVGVLLSGALFSMLHVNIAGFLPIMILGVLMAYLYEETGSLVTSISVHIVHNSIIVGFVFFIKELLR
ncbi:MAG: CPBP family intramembrane metalloprotease [Candidatus Omnitrophica bacterium]|nr:CPBP family intramembrane metalloprotease [Candidatus Omnitrophota bacterium]